MPLTISFDMTGVNKRLDAMAKQLASFPEEMSKEFIDWQSKDMRRRQPWATADQEGVETIITPRGTRETPHKGFGKPRIPTRIMGARRSAQSMRPILRVELYKKLVDRMNALMEKCLSWQ